MAALPKGFENEVVDRIAFRTSKAFDGVVSQFKALGNDLTRSTKTALDTIKQPFISFGDAFKINASSRGIDRMQAIIPKLFGMGDKQADTVNDSIRDLKKVTEKGFGDTVTVLDDLQRFFEWQSEKDEGEKGKFKPSPRDNKPDEEKKPETPDFLANFKKGFKGLIGNVFRKVAMGAGLVSLAALVTDGIFQGIKDWSKGAEFGKQFGQSDLSGSMTAMLTGIEGDIMSRIGAIGRWAGVGATLGVGGGIPGILLGGILGGVFGGLMIGLENLIGRDTVGRYVDGIVDGFATTIELFTGADLERINGRINDLKSARENAVEAATKAYDNVVRLESELNEARIAGDDATARVLERRLNSAKAAQEAAIKQVDKYGERIESFEREAAIASMAWHDRLFEYSKSFTNFSIDMIAGTFGLLFGQNAKDEVYRVFDQMYIEMQDALSRGFDYIYESGISIKDSFMGYFENSKQGIVRGLDTIDGYINDGINFVLNLQVKAAQGVYDSIVGVGTFFTETVPETFGSFMERIRSRINDALGQVKELSSAMYEELSFDLLNPFSDDKRSYADRVADRLTDMRERRRIQDDAAANNANADAAFDAINENFERRMTEATTNNTASVEQTNISNKTEFVKRNMSVRDPDQTAQNMSLFANGVAIAP